MKKSLLPLLLLWLPALLGARGIDHADLFVATAGDHGQNDPSATVPYGMVRVGPDTDPRSHSGYNYEKNTLLGFSVNRYAGVGCNGTGGNLRIRPLTAGETAVLIDKTTEHAVPGYYEATLTNGIRVTLTATRNMAIERFHFGPNREIELEVDPRSSLAKLTGAGWEVLSSTALSGWYQARNVCDRGLYKQYFHLKAGQPFELVRGEKPLLRFSKEETPYVEIRIALSPLSEAAALLESAVQEDVSFEQAQRTAYDTWAAKLGKIEVEGDESDLKMFYSSLYRVFLSPSDVTSSRGLYLDSGGRVRQAEGFTYYSGWSLWDTYRTKFPLLSLLEGELYGQFCRSLAELYRSGKDAWATPHESTPTCRTEHAGIILLDALRKGIGGFDLNTCYEQMKKEAETLSMASPDNFLESAYDLWALAGIAGELGHEEDRRKYARMSEETWEEIWKEKFMRIDDSTFDIMHGDGLYEGTLWQYRWAVPFATETLAEIAGGRKTLAKELEYFFSHDLYNHGNQPDIHAAYLFNRFGRPDLTQKWVTRILAGEMTQRYGTHKQFKTPYRGKIYRPEPRGFIPEMDDDDATMSSWYVFSSMGLFPLVVGEPYYEITAPLFRKITLRLDNGRTFVIENRRTPGSAKPIERLTLNGNRIEEWRIGHADILRGGVLVIE
ncbi:glycoside hydrolase domain-containing protein [Gallalistipes aquisgranensis]|uniref:glycoside hydrolase domain-containing protein n=1 Tax=Gallalistipes aquisgranensis TaxID=2779358 RepID=UPI001CF8C87C|nr:glycoside hydrolase domain-containing protein [Gallalistipes aquisgranensis]MBE5033844.1 glycoside hydrolase family 92 protein [Gallalistipes aquisgranensis]